MRKRFWKPAGVEQSKTRKTRSKWEKIDPTIFFLCLRRLFQCTSSGRGAKLTLREQEGAALLEISDFT